MAWIQGLSIEKYRESRQKTEVLLVGGIEGNCQRMWSGWYEDAGRAACTPG
jgi:hypothetical protein